MPVPVQVQTVHPRKLAAVRRELAPDAVGAAWRLALAEVWPFIRSRPGLWTNGHNIFLYHHPAQPGGQILCDFGVEVTRGICNLPREVKTSDRDAGWRSCRRSTPGPVQPYERDAPRDPRVDDGQPQGVRWSLVGDIRRSDTGSGPHGDDGPVSPKVAFAGIGRTGRHPYRDPIRGAQTAFWVARDPTSVVGSWLIEGRQFWPAQ